jgi:hypothetical protein
MPSGGTSAILMVLFSLATIASTGRADLLGVDVERGDELDVADVVAAELDVHEPGDGVGRVGVAVVLDALDERRGAVADADDGYADGTHGLLPLVSGAVIRSRGGWCGWSGRCGR